MLLVQSFSEVFQSGFARQSRIRFLHSVHEVLCSPAVFKDIFHFLQITDLELYGISLGCSAVTADEQFGT